VAVCYAHNPPNKVVHDVLFEEDKNLHLDIKINDNINIPLNDISFELCVGKPRCGFITKK
jgi:hypothetical protein